jgi:hypothetical protein
LNRFSGGQPSTNGDFSGVAKKQFLNWKWQNHKCLKWNYD